jgi:hypothetical protein
MALLKDYGFVISMTAIEKNPLRRFWQKDDPVYNDSAMEAFLNFAPHQAEQHYLNFEMNANGALLSAFGSNRKRETLSKLTTLSAACKAELGEASWSILLEIPMELICSIYPIQPLLKGDSFTCNFYKISEDPAIEHYASFAPIQSDLPNFHLPEFFENTIIV